MWTKYVVGKCEKKNITNVITYRVPDMDSDHFAIGVKLTSIIHGIKNKKKIPRRIEEENKVNYKGMLIKEFENMVESHAINESRK